LTCKEATAAFAESWRRGHPRRVLVFHCLNLSFVGYRTSASLQMGGRLETRFPRPLRSHAARPKKNLGHAIAVVTFKAANITGEAARA
jgi:hypothetical protein